MKVYLSIYICIAKVTEDHCPAEMVTPYKISYYSISTSTKFDACNCV